MFDHKYSDTVSKLATVKQAMDRYKICRNSLMDFATEHGAVVRFGRSVRIDCQKLDSCLEYEGQTG